MKKRNCTEKTSGSGYSEVDMTGARYLISLREKQEELKIEILEFCKSKAAHAISVMEIYDAIKGHYPIPDKDSGKENVILQGIIRNLLLVLVAHGELEEQKSETGVGCFYLFSNEDTIDVA